MGAYGSRSSGLEATQLLASTWVSIWQLPGGVGWGIERPRPCHERDSFPTAVTTTLTSPITGPRSEGSYLTCAYPSSSSWRLERMPFNPGSPTPWC